MTSFNAGHPAESAASAVDTGTSPKRMSSLIPAHTGGGGGGGAGAGAPLAAGQGQAR